MRDSVLFYRSFYEALKNIPDEDRLKVYDTIMEYSMNDINPILDGVPLAIFLLIKPQIDANNKRYKSGCEPKSKQNASESEANNKQNRSESEARRKQSRSETEANGKRSVSESEAKEKEKEKENVKEKENKYTCAFEALWSAYPRKKDKGMAYKQYKARLNDGFSEDELITAVKRYADECQRQRTDERYIKHCTTFLGASTPFLDYLREEEPKDGRIDYGYKLSDI